MKIALLPQFSKKNAQQKTNVSCKCNPKCDSDRKVMWHRKIAIWLHIFCFATKNKIIKRNAMTIHQKRKTRRNEKNRTASIRIGDWLHIITENQSISLNRFAFFCVCVCSISVLWSKSLSWLFVSFECLSAFRFTISISHTG